MVSVHAEQNQQGCTLLSSTRDASQESARREIKIDSNPELVRGSAPSKALDDGFFGQVKTTWWTRIPFECRLETAQLILARGKAFKLAYSHEFPLPSEIWKYLRQRMQRAGSPMDEHYWTQAVEYGGEDKGGARRVENIPAVQHEEDLILSVSRHATQGPIANRDNSTNLWSSSGMWSLSILRHVSMNYRAGFKKKGIQNMLHPESLL